MPLTENRLPGVEVPMPKFPLLSITRAGVVEVANVEGDVVAKYRVLDIERMVHALLVPVVSKRANCGAVDDARLTK